MGEAKVSGSGRAVEPLVTEAGERFFAEQMRLLEFYVFVVESQIVLFTDMGARSKNGKVQAADGYLVGEMDSHNELVNEMLVCRVVDNVLTYVTELLALVYGAKPEMLRSSEQERVEFVLQFQTMDELRRALAEKRVERLSYLGFRELSEYLFKEMGFQLFSVRHDEEKAVVLVELRNAIVHNRGIIGKRAGARVPVLKDKVGKRVGAVLGGFLGESKFFYDAMFEIDARASQKFGLPVRPLRVIRRVRPVDAREASLEGLRERLRRGSEVQT
ncbi:MAG: hypothetical protein HY322_02205 [Betaproteobacteria bacterium]|nr:hypothetical protein [Betaproteobacteria bacterium]